MPCELFNYPNHHAVRKFKLSKGIVWMERERDRETHVLAHICVHTCTHTYNTHTHVGA